VTQHTHCTTRSLLSTYHTVLPCTRVISVSPKSNVRPSPRRFSQHSQTLDSTVCRHAILNARTNMQLRPHWTALKSVAQTSAAPNLIPTGHRMYTTTPNFNLRPYIKYGCNLAEFRKARTVSPNNVRVRNSSNKLHDNPTKGSVADTKLLTDGRTVGRCHHIRRYLLPC